MKSSLRKKYVGVVSLLIVGFLGFLILTTSLLRDEFVKHWNQDKMDALSARVLTDLERADWNLQEVDFDSLAFENNVSITFANDEFQILSSTRAREAYRGNLGKKSLKAIEENDGELENTGKGFYSDFDDDNKASFIHITRIKGFGYLLIRKSVSGMNGSIFAMEMCFVIAAVLTLICAIPVIIWLSGKMVRPIREINRVTGQIAKLNFDEKVVVESRDELGELAHSVNIMSDKLKEVMDSLTRDVENRKALVRNMAHELKTPTAVIMGYAENMPYIAQNQPEKLEKYCTVISDECERMDALICQMLEVSACETGGDVRNQMLFPVKDLLGAVRRRFEDEFPDRKEIYEEVNETQGKILGDFQSLQNALYNLVKNAVRYGKEGGPIRLHTRIEGPYVYFFVFNEGDGIPEEEQEKIWDVFYKLDTARTRKEKSFGVGLSIVKQTALAHEGNVFIQNRDSGVEIGFFILFSDEKKPEKQK